MCRTVFVRPGGYDCNNFGELAKAIGGSPIYKTLLTRRPSDCLCDLDAIKTAEAFGLELVSKPDDWIVVFSNSQKGT